MQAELRVDYLGLIHPEVAQFRLQPLAGGTSDTAGVSVDEETLFSEQLPEEMVFLLVGKWDEIAPGDAEKRASMAEFFGGAVTHLPQRDPLTLEPME